MGKIIKCMCLHKSPSQRPSTGTLHGRFQCHQYWMKPHTPEPQDIQECIHSSLAELLHGMEGSVDVKTMHVYDTQAEDSENSTQPLYLYECPWGRHHGTWFLSSLQGTCLLFPPLVVSHSFYQNKDRETFTSLAIFFCLGQLSCKSGVFQLQNMETGNWQLAARCHCPSLGDISFADFWVATVSIWSECHWVLGEGYLMHSVNMTVTCCGLNEKCSLLSETFEYLDPRWWQCLGRFPRYGLAKVSVSLGVSSKSLRTSTILSVFFQLHACGSRCVPMASCSCCHAFAPPSWALTIWNCKASKLFLL